MVSEKLKLIGYLILLGHHGNHSVTRYFRSIFAKRIKLKTVYLQIASRNYNFELSKTKLYQIVAQFLIYPENQFHRGWSARFLRETWKIGIKLEKCPISLS